MQTNTSIVALLTQSFSRPGGGNPALLTDAAGRAVFDQVLGQQFGRSVDGREFTMRESFGDRIQGDRSLSGAREKVHNDPAETPVRSDRPEYAETPAATDPETRSSEARSPEARSPEARSPVENRPELQDEAPVPADRSGTPVTSESENPQTSAEVNVLSATESPADEISNNLNAGQQALRDRLEQLNIDPQIIDTLVKGLANNNPQANALLQSLNGLLNGAGAAQTGTGARANAGTAQAGLPANLVLQKLIQAGLSETDARKVIEQASAALASKQTDSKTGAVLSSLPPVDGLKGNGTATPGDKLPAKPITQSLPLAQNQAETKSDSDSKNSSNANSDKLEKLAVLLRNDTNPLTQTTSPFKLAANPIANLNGKPVTPLNVASADGLAVQAAPAVDSAGKAADAFKPVLAETYGQRGAVAKTVASQIIERISFRGTGSQREINIKLDPPSLGSVRMNVSSAGESVRTTIVVENHFVKQVIESHLPQLRDSLANQGVKVDHFSVLVGGDSAQNTAHQQESAGPTTNLRLANEDLRDTVEEGVLLTRGPVIFNESTINVFA